MSSKQPNTKVGLLMFGLLLLGSWVLVCSYCMWWLITDHVGSVNEKLLGSLAWPFVTVLLAIPLLSLIMLGGLRTLGQIVSLKHFLDELPTQVSTLEKITANIEQQRSLFENSKNLIAEAAEAIDQSISQLADAEGRIKKIRESELETDAAQDDDLTGTDLIDALSSHLEAARQIFDFAASNYEAANNQSVRRVRGWILEQSVNELKQTGFLSNAQASYVQAALDVDRRTRRSARSTLTQDDIQNLDALKANIQV